MKSVYLLVKNIRNLLPYLVLIAIYFFFVNIEAKKEINFQKTIEDVDLSVEKKKSFDEQIKIRIPVIPFKE